MRLLVTGGAGRLGSELVRLIAERGDEALAFDVPQASWDTVRGIRGVEVVRGDVTETEQVAEACKDVDGVFHLAAILPPRSEADRGLTMRVNYEGTRNIVKALERRPDAPLIFASSVSAYGITAREEPPIREDHPLIAHNNYSESKIEAERLIRGSGIRHIILRIAPISVAEVVELPETIPYRADQRVEFVYVADVARAILSAMERPEAIGRTFNIAGGPSWQMTGAEYIESFYDALGVDVKPIFSEAYTGADWYDTSRSRILVYQRTTFNRLLDRLRVLGEELGLR